MGLLVIKPGLFTTVQDEGRTGVRAYGVPMGGAFDRGSAELANALLGNHAGAAVLEMTLFGGTFEALVPLALALAGAPMSAVTKDRNGRETPRKIPVAFPLDAGVRLILGGSPRGARAYLAVGGGGWRTPVVLKSLSSETPVKAGDVLPGREGWTPVRRPDPRWVTFAPADADAGPIRVIDGPDAGRLRADPFDGGGSYRVGTHCDRMGLRLEGGPAWAVGDDDPGRVSTPVAPGAVQAAGGRPLVLGVACGTMGGYPHVAHVISADLDRLGQARPGDLVRFARVSLAEARWLDREARALRRTRLAHVGTAAADVPRRGQPPPPAGD